MRNLEKINKEKECRINELTNELSTYKNIHRNHLKTIANEKEDFYKQEVYKI